jgi:hypothetical protein
MNASGSINIIMSSREGKVFHHLKMMKELLGKPCYTQCQQAVFSLGRIAKKLQQSGCFGVVY